MNIQAYRFTEIVTDDELTDDNTIRIKYLVRQAFKSKLLSYILPEGDDSDDVDIANILLVQLPMIIVSYWALRVLS